MGTPQAAVPSLARLLEDGHDIVAVYTQPDRPSGRGNKITFSPVKIFAEGHGLPFYQPTKIKAEETQEVFRSHEADVAVVVAYGRILPAAYLTAFPKGAVNVHFSLLPKLRGAAPVNWAIVNGDTVTGVTTMRMDEGLDTGAILLQRETQIGSDETSIELMDRLSIHGAELLSETLAGFDQITPTVQNNDLATLAPIMRREDGLIDWNKSAGSISDQIRGFQPFPGSYSIYQGGKLAIWKAVVAVELEDRSFIPGTIFDVHGDTLIIGCGAGSALSIEELQPEGKRRMSVRDFNNGIKPKVGSHLGT